MLSEKDELVIPKEVLNDSWSFVYSRWKGNIKQSCANLHVKDNNAILHSWKAEENVCGFNWLLFPYYNIGLKISLTCV